MVLLTDRQLERLAQKVDVLYGTMDNFYNVVAVAMDLLNFARPQQRGHMPWLVNREPQTLDDVIGYSFWPKRYQDFWLKANLRYGERFELILFLEGNGKDMRIYLPWLIHFGALNWHADRISIMNIIDDIKNQNVLRHTWRFYSIHRRLWCYITTGEVVPNVQDRIY